MGRILSRRPRRLPIMLARVRSLFSRPRDKPPAPAAPRIDDAIVLLNRGRQEEAISAMRERLRAAPEDKESWLWLGRAYVRAHRPEDAVEAFDEAAELEKDEHARALIHSERALAAGDGASAAALLESAIARRPPDARALELLAHALLSQGRHTQAEAALGAALALQPDSLALHGAWCALLTATRGFEAARAAYLEALLRFPAQALLHYNYGVLCSRNGRKDIALDAYARAASLDPDLHLARLNLALDLFILGRYREGGAIYESRWELSSALAGVYGFPRTSQWQGGPLDGKSLLLWAEQGFGDTLQMIRYVPAVAARGAASVHVRVPAPFLRLFRQVPGVTSWISESAAADRTRFDLQCPLMSLPFVFGATVDTVPAAIPYLAADPYLTTTWRQFLGPPRTATRVGLVWSSGAWGGGGMAEERGEKSIPLAALAPFAGLDGIDWISLQVDPARGELACGAHGFELADTGARIKDFADTAAVIENLDLVVSVDTSTAHLAGAMGKPVLMLLKHGSGMFWLLERDDSQWYPTLRIVRQSVPGQWAEVVMRARAIIARFARTRSLDPSTAA